MPPVRKRGIATRTHGIEKTAAMAPIQLRGHYRSACLIALPWATIWGRAPCPRPPSTDDRESGDPCIVRARCARVSSAHDGDGSRRGSLRGGAKSDRAPRAPVSSELDRDASRCGRRPHGPNRDRVLGTCASSAVARRFSLCGPLRTESDGDRGTRKGVPRIVAQCGASTAAGRWRNALPAATGGDFSAAAPRERES
jgi:hypothetical protein